jgi:hypothetical protein
MALNPHITVSLFHIFAVVPFFLYVAFVRGQLPPWIFPLLLGLGLLLAVYHSYKTILKWKAHSLSAWVNIFHVVAVAPILIYMGAKGYDTPRWAFEVLAMLGFAALGYHIYSIVLELQDMNDKTASVKKMMTED